MAQGKIIFITGTDTGVGKTLLTALLLHHLRGNGMHALAMKPFCSGGRGDVRLLQSLQPGELADAEMNPFYFDAPLAPLAAAKPGGTVRLRDALEKIRRVAARCELLLVEGSGGLLVPLGPGFTIADLIERLNGRVMVVARNRLGTINHTSLTVAALEQIGIKRSELRIVLMAAANPDISSRTNSAVLRRLLAPARVVCLPHLGRRTATKASIKRHARNLSSLLGLCVNGC